MFRDNFARVFRDCNETIQQGYWTVRFAGKRIVLPITGTSAWLEWDLAVSILGHEVDITITYETLIKSRRRPAVFFDVGANYGLHSLLFLTQGVQVISFEPNGACHGYLRSASSLNHVEVDIQPLALGDTESWVELLYPENDTWLGTIVPQEQRHLRSVHGQLNRSRVRQIALDEFVKQHKHAPQLIKIDTEGNELAVLRGSRETLRTCRPLVIFESRPSTERGGLACFLKEANYHITCLPLLQETLPPRFDERGFLASQARNFLAVPAERFAKDALLS